MFGALHPNNNTDPMHTHFSQRLVSVIIRKISQNVMDSPNCHVHKESPSGRGCEAAFPIQKKASENPHGYLSWGKIAYSNMCRLTPQMQSETQYTYIYFIQTDLFSHKEGPPFAVYNWLWVAWQLLECTNTEHYTICPLPLVQFMLQTSLENTQILSTLIKQNHFNLASRHGQSIILAKKFRK